MENLIFSLNATVPIFLLMILGIFLRKIGWVDHAFASKMNTFVFRLPLPVLVFSDLATVDFYQVWDVRFVLFCFFATLFSIALGIAFIQNIYGTAGMAPLMIVGSVPLYNIMAVLVLSLCKSNQQGLSGDVLKNTLKGIVTNPILIGIAAGLLWSAIGIPMPSIAAKTISNIGSIATPMGLIAMGASFDFQKARAKLAPAVTASFLKLIGFAALFLPLAVSFGFREEKLVAILVMLGSATTVSSFVMAKNMEHEGVLSSSVVMLTTMFSAFTLTGWLYLLKCMGVI